LICVLKGKIEITALYVLCGVCLFYVIGAMKYNLFWSFLGSLYVLKAPIAFVAGCLLINRNRQIDSAFKTIRLIGLITSIISIIDYVFGIDNIYKLLQYEFSREGVTGIFHNANKNGMMCVFSVISYFYFSDYKKKYFPLMIIIIAMLLTGSRQSLVFLFLFLIIFIISNRNLKPSYKTRMIFSFFIISSIFVYLLGDFIIERTFMTISNMENETNFRLYASFVSFKVFLDNPVFGSGVGTFGGSIAHMSNSKLNEYYNLFDYYNAIGGKAITTDVFWAHFIAETGALGIIFYLTFFMFLLIRLRKLKAHDCRSQIFYAVLFPLFLSGLFGFSLEASFIEIFAFLILGGHFAIMNKEIHKRSLIKCAS
jgi:hypothetical protein